MIVAAGALAYDVRERVLEQLPLARAPDRERGIPSSFGSRLDRHEPRRSDRLRLTLRRHGLDRLDLDCVADESQSLLAHQHLAGPRGLLEPGGYV